MATINISLPDKLKAKADKFIRQGYYVSFSDLVRTALRGLMEEPKRVRVKSGSLRELLNRQALAAFCKQNKISYLGLFGSLARGEDLDKSDVDLLVKFDKNSQVGLFDLARMERELERQFNRPVELVTKLNKHVEPYALKDMMTLYEKR